MPELPEVEALAHHLRERLVGRRVSRVELASLAALKTFDPPLHSLEGQRIERVSRQGKFLITDLEAASLVVHFARAGWLQWRDDLPDGPTRPGKGPLALRVGVVTVDGEPAGGFDITEAGTTKGLALYVVTDTAAVPGITRLGPDALELDVDQLAEILAAHPRSHIKNLLREQGVLSGIGNAYSDEILHLAQVSPFAPAGSVDASALQAAIQATLTQARDRAIAADVSRLKSEKRDGLRVHGRAGQDCPVCGDTIGTVSFSGRSLEYCPTCQTGGKPLADRRLSRLLK